jgi:hypothetical protein
MERIYDPQVSILLVFLQVFGQQIPAVSQLSSRNNQSIPPGNLITILNKPCVFQNTRVYHHRLPCQQRANVPAGIFRIKTRLQLSGNGQVKFLQNLIAQFARPCAPKMNHPGHGELLLLWFGSVPAVNKDVGVNEDLCGHKAPRGRATVLPGISKRLVVLTDIAASQSDSFAPRSFFRGAVRRPGEKHLCSVQRP